MHVFLFGVNAGRNIKKGPVLYKSFTDFDEYSYTIPMFFCVVFLCRACLLFGVNAGRNIKKGSVVHKNFTDFEEYSYTIPMFFCVVHVSYLESTLVDIFSSPQKDYTRTPSLRPFARLRRVAQAEPLAIPVIHSPRPTSVANSVCPANLVFNFTRLQLDAPKCQSPLATRIGGTADRI